MKFLGTSWHPAHCALLLSVSISSPDALIMSHWHFISKVPVNWLGIQSPWTLSSSLSSHPARSLPPNSLYRNQAQLLKKALKILDSTPVPLYMLVLLPTWPIFFSLFTETQKSSMSKSHTMVFIWNRGNVLPIYAYCISSKFYVIQSFVFYSLLDFVLLEIKDNVLFISF